MNRILLLSLLLTMADIAKATTTRTMDNSLRVPPKRFVSLSVMPTNLLPPPTRAPAFYAPVLDEMTPTADSFSQVADSPTSLPTAYPPVLPPISASSQSPSVVFVSSPTMVPTTVPTTVSDYPSMVPSISVIPTSEPSSAPVEVPTKRPTNGIIISAVSVIGLELSLINAGTLLQTDQWRMATEDFYNGYFEDITCLVTFVKSDVSDQKERSVNIITYDLLLQSDFVMITNPMQYAIEPFLEKPTNILYGQVLRKLANFEGLSLPLSAPEVPKRTMDHSKGFWSILADLNDHAILGIVVAGLLVFLFVTYRCNRWCNRRRQSKKPSEEPNCTFRISSDDEESTIGPVDEKNHSGENTKRRIFTADPNRSTEYGGPTNHSNSARTLRTNNPASAGARGNNHEKLTNGERIEVLAPSGKLGITISIPDNGPPVIQGITGTTAFQNQIHIGDKLIAIDDEEVLGMSSLEVSKMISSKSSNPQRKLTIMRPYDVINIT